MVMTVEWELMGRDRGEMAGDITLKGYSYTLALALLWKAMSHFQDTTQEVLWQSVLAVAELMALSIQFNSGSKLVG
jgi:hypothetical protein